jgi:CBS domain-containing protein
MSVSQSLFDTISCSSVLKEGDGSRIHVLSPEQPLIIVGALYASLDVESVVVAENFGLSTRQVVRFLGGDAVLRALVTRPETLWPYLMKAAVSDVARSVSYVQGENTLSDALQAMRRQGYGTLIVLNKEAEFLGVLNLLMILRVMHRREVFRAVLGKIKLSDIIANNYATIKVSKDETVLGAVYHMLNRGVRRLLVDGEDKVVSDKSIIRYLMGSAAPLESLRDQPYLLLDEPLSSLESYFESPGACSSGDTVEEVLKELLKSEAKCVLVDGGQGIATPWDLTVKLHQFITENPVPSPA